MSGASACGLPNGRCERSRSFVPMAGTTRLTHTFSTVLSALEFRYGSRTQTAVSTENLGSVDRLVHAGDRQRRIPRRVGRRVHIPQEPYQNPRGQTWMLSRRTADALLRIVKQPDRRGCPRRGSVAARCRTSTSESRLNRSIRLSHVIIGRPTTCLPCRPVAANVRTPERGCAC